MSASKNYIVTLRRTWNPTARQWGTALTARAAANVDVEAAKRDSFVIAVFEVRALSQSAAEGIVVEWLYRGRPSAMTVTEITSDLVNVVAS